MFSRTLSVNIATNGRKLVNFFRFYAPTLLADPEKRGNFYWDLLRLLQNTPADDKILILSDLNAIVGQDSEAWKGALGRHGAGNCNDNGCLLLKFCTDH